MSNSQSAESEKRAGPKPLSIDVLDGEHRSALVRAITRVLSTDIAEITYAQIIDGLPLAEVAQDTSRVAGIHDDHPLHDAHTKLCGGVLEQTRDFRDKFDPSILKFNPTLILAYQAASPGSPSFKTRLIELVAVSVHQVAVLIVHLDTNRHKDDGITSWTPPKDDFFYWQYREDGAPPTLFNHQWYLDHKQYPDGVADMVGYWAEARILGGVVLFDRRPAGSAVGSDPDTIYFHSDRMDVTYRIYQLLDEQKNALLEFLLAETPPGNPLPILGDRENWRRVDPEEPIASTGVYRDIWERKDIGIDGPDSRCRDVWNKMEYPTWDDFNNARGRWFQKKSRNEDSYEGD